MHDTPKQEVFEDMEAGIGYVAGIGYEFIEKVGFDLGVMHSTHEYRLGMRGQAIMKDKADKTAIFIRGRFLPMKTKQYEIELGAGPAYYSIAGNVEAEDDGISGEMGFYGWGYTAALELKHFASKNLAVTFYISTNIVKYGKQTFNTLTVAEPTRLPRGNSISWGLTLFYRIGKISLD